MSYCSFFLSWNKLAQKTDLNIEYFTIEKKNYKFKSKKIFNTVQLKDLMYNV